LVVGGIVIIERERMADGGGSDSDSIADMLSRKIITIETASITIDGVSRTEASLTPDERARVLRVINTGIVKYITDSANPEAPTAARERTGAYIVERRRSPQTVGRERITFVFGETPFGVQRYAARAAATRSTATNRDVAH